MNTKHTFFIVVGLGLILAGATCEASPALRARYTEEVARCIANERAIVDREDTTRAQDEDDLEAERARCDAALAEIGGAP